MNILMNITNFTQYTLVESVDNINTYISSNFIYIRYKLDKDSYV